MASFSLAVSHAFLKRFMSTAAGSPGRALTEIIYSALSNFHFLVLGHLGRERGTVAWMAAFRTCTAMLGFCILQENRNSTLTALFRQNRHVLFNRLAGPLDVTGIRPGLCIRELHELFNCKRLGDAISLDKIATQLAQ